MKYILLLLLFPVFAYAQKRPSNQSLFDTIPFIPDHTIERLEIFKKQPVTKGGIIFLGNSITEMGNWAKLLNDTTVLNRGIGGDITYGVLKRLDDIINRQPKKLFILLGINDIGKDIPESVIAYNYFKIIKQVKEKSPATTIYVQSILPLNPTLNNFPQHYDKGEHIPRVNAMLKANAAIMGYTYINLQPLFVDAQNRLDAKYTYEGLHLKPEAYVVWVAYLKKMKYL
ncbi:GDSL-type esterase/lipase family protein [Mucilaginibacter aquariorum]|uniref:GDSL-type esterase/lipase family protein n=1 Tax=Mucilaginibacter aquariorum TaxID=2967225 RepID=A0ABT1SZT3_9SPHI|nr:GDSL-type esterase/lipase family protein [Mucilaginibacter aquariorum]MCQ6957839.1 GDSL-type esterase/lipase family protein [Mucilaginibacter aquariorum]